jgi:hypothetical protein
MCPHHFQPKRFPFLSFQFGVDYIYVPNVFPYQDVSLCISYKTTYFKKKKNPEVISYPKFLKFSSLKAELIEIYLNIVINFFEHFFFIDLQAFMI